MKNGYMGKVIERRKIKFHHSLWNNTTFNFNFNFNFKSSVMEQDLCSLAFYNLFFIEVIKLRSCFKIIEIVIMSTSNPEG